MYQGIEESRALNSQYVETGSAYIRKAPIKVYVDETRALHITSPSFVSLCISSSVFQVPLRMKAFDFR